MNTCQISRMTLSGRKNPTVRRASVPYGVRKELQAESSVQDNTKHIAKVRTCKDVSRG